MGFCNGRVLLVLSGVLCLFSLGLGAALPQDLTDNDDTVPPSLPIDQLILLAAQNNVDEDSPFRFGENSNLVRREYDMVFTALEWADIMRGNRQKRTAAIFPNWREKRWTNNVVNFQLENGSFSKREKKEIYQGVRDISKYTCLTMKETSSASNRILVEKGDGGCYSYVGMIGGVQSLGLDNGCRYKRIVIHEFLHAIGIHHEQTRPDRDDHVDIRLEHIKDSVEYNFDKYNWNYINNYSLPYDYISVMHYGPTAFSETGENTIVTHDDKYQNLIGQNPGLSAKDIQTLNSMHNCVADNCQLTNAICARQGGFVGKDCKCWCEGEEPFKTPVEYCSAQDVEDNGSLNDCKDLDPNCSEWESQGECGNKKYWAFMYTYCPKSCNMC